MSQKKKLVIVESPAKCKKIESILGKDYICKASMGHIRLLKSVDIDKDFSPNFILDPKKNANTKELINISKKCSETIIASDLDREGEAIGFHLIEVLGLNPKTTKRIVFNEITKKSITQAIESPKLIDYNMYNAQKTRLMLDQIVGFQLSPILWKYIRRGLSAGRVQSPGLKILCEREHKIDEFTPERFYKITGHFQLDTNIIQATLDQNITDKKPTLSFLELCQKATFKITNLKNSDSSRSPPQPFITSTLQQEASKVHGIPPKSCMHIAQKLYEAGLITYMRTDSVILSDKALNDIEKYIKDEYTDEYYHRRVFKNKNDNSQEAHEAIRPVEITNTNIRTILDDPSCQKLYTLIWKRTVASQMKPMKINITKIEISLSNTKDYYFISTINRVIFDGYTKVYKNEESEVDGENENLLNLKNLEKGQQVNYQSISAKEDLTRPPTRFSEADLIKDLEKKGIGRPSTYSSIITIIQERGYAKKEDSQGETKSINILELEASGKIKDTQEDKVFEAFKSKLVVTDIGKIVNEFLYKNFQSTINYNFTSQLEDKLDLIAKGQIDWLQTLNEFYRQFSPTVIKLNKTSIDMNEDSLKRRYLGLSTNQNKIYVTHVKNGLVVVAEADPSQKKLYTRFAEIPKNLSYDTISLDQAKSLLIYPLVLGLHNGKEVKVNSGKFGKYFTYDGKNYSLKDIEEVTMKTVKNILETKTEEIDNSIIKQLSKDITLKKGKIINDKQLPPFLQVKSAKSTKFIPLPKEKDPYEVSLEEAKQIIENYTPGKRFTKKKLKIFNSLI